MDFLLEKKPNKKSGFLLFSGLDCPLGRCKSALADLIRKNKTARRRKLKQIRAISGLDCPLGRCKSALADLTNEC